MTKSITKERVQELLSAGKPNNDTDTVIASDTDSTGNAMNWGELRALLAAYGRECQWTLKRVRLGQHRNRVGSVYVTECGHTLDKHDYQDGRPCWCGGKVKVTR